MTPQELAAMRSEAPLLACAYFDGPDVTPEDCARLKTQQVKIREYMLRVRDWRTAQEVADACGLVFTAGTSARIRDLRKPRWGGYIVERQRRSRGLWEYKLVTLTAEGRR
jgi:hypothetical protein